MSNAAGFVVGAVLALAGGAVGWVARGVPASGSEAPVCTRVEVADPALADELAKVRALLEGLRRDEAPVLSSAPRVPAAGEGADLTAQLARIEDLVRSLARGTSPTPVAARAPEAPSDSTRGAGYANVGALGELWRRKLAEEARDQTSDAHNAFYDQLRDSHFFWTFEEVLARYGTPDEVNSGQGGLELEYAWTDAAGHRFTLDFTIREGRVTSSGWSG